MSSIASGRHWPPHDFGYASGAMPATAQRSSPDAAPPLPADDPPIFEMDLRGLRRHWATQAALPAISAETMTGADRRAQALGVPGAAPDGACRDGRCRGCPGARHRTSVAGEQARS